MPPLRVFLEPRSACIVCCLDGRDSAWIIRIVLTFSAALAFAQRTSVQSVFGVGGGTRGTNMGANMVVIHRGSQAHGRRQKEKSVGNLQQCFAWV